MPWLLCKSKSVVCDSCNNCSKCNCKCQDSVQSDLLASRKRPKNEAALGQHRQACENIRTRKDCFKSPGDMYTTLGLDPNSQIIRHLPSKEKRSSVTTWMDNSPKARSMKTRVFQVYKEIKLTFISKILCGDAADISLAETVNEFIEKRMTKNSSKSVKDVVVKTMSSAVKKTNTRVEDNKSFALLFANTGGSEQIV